MKKNYTLHFRNAGIPFVVLELTFHKEGYGAFDYIVLYKNKLAEGYLSEKGLKQTKEFGLQLLDSHKEIYKRLEKFKRKLENFSDTSWENLKELMKEFGVLYRYCEQPVLAGIEELFEKNCDDVNKCLQNTDEYGLNEEGKRALEILNKFGKIKYNIHIAIEKPLRALLELLADIPHSDYMTSEEVDKLLSGANPEEIKEIEKNASERNGVIIIDRKVRFDYDSWKEKVKGKDENDLNIIKGKGASLGKVKGKVKVFISSIESGEEMPKDSVVVSGMTNPQMVPNLKKAAAMVTDEGGITCHAAIISRELGIPAVVGTQIATEVLKDGDLVEVDADKGIVRIIERAKK